MTDRQYKKIEKQIDTMLNEIANLPYGSPEQNKLIESINTLQKTLSDEDRTRIDEKDKTARREMEQEKSNKQLALSERSTAADEENKKIASGVAIVGCGVAAITGIGGMILTNNLRRDAMSIEETGTVRTPTLKRMLGNIKFPGQK